MSIHDSPEGDSDIVYEIASNITRVIIETNVTRERPDQTIKALLFVLASVYTARFNPIGSPEESLPACLELAGIAAEAMELATKRDILKRFISAAESN